jgi:hypothetical protein
MLRAEIPMRSIDFLQFTYKSVPGKVSVSKARPARKADNLTAIYRPIAYTMCYLRRLNTLKTQPVMGINFTSLYVHDVRTSQDTHLWASTACYGDNFTFLYVDDVRACYGDNFTFLYVDDVRTSQDTHLWASTACYGDNFTFLYVDDVRISQDTHLWACYGYNFTFLYVDDVRACYGDNFTFLYVDDVRGLLRR